MTKTTKQNQKVRDYIINKIELDGYKEDRYGNWKNKTGEFRYNFKSTSYQFESQINTKPPQWIKISETYYKNISICES